jgi:hypothetical protein
MGKSTIEYRIAIEDNPGSGVTLLVDLNEDGFTTHVDTKNAAWTALRNHTCPHCPLARMAHKTCPVAARIAPFIDIFSEVASYERVDVTVIIGSRTIQQRVTLQQALASVIGLLVATSGCPHSNFFRPLALDHQPFVTEAETTYRVVANYMAHQFVRINDGAQADLSLEGLHELYDRIHELNICIAKRLRAVSGAEPILNGIALLDTYAVSIPFKLKNSSNGFSGFYANYLAEREQELSLAAPPLACSRPAPPQPAPQQR